MMMIKLINNIYQTLKDYRADENESSVKITPERIMKWINQFDKKLRIPILEELDNIFKKRYFSKSMVRNFLDKMVQDLTRDFNFSNASEFLRNSNFLNLQPEGKSQGIMLKLFNELIQKKYGLSLDDCGTISKRYSIYIDDILCTGLTLITDIKQWLEQMFSPDKTNAQAVADDSTTLVLVYIFIHKKNYLKKKAEIRHKISVEVSSKHKMYRVFEIQNDTSSDSKIDLIYPLENGQPSIVNEYKEKITHQVDIYTLDKYNRVFREEFYRPAGLPVNEKFFTSPKNRILVENAFLRKGIEILQNANSQNSNIRALGYSIPSLKNFGFGALCFTWRNIPNNAPLVFWYSGGGFFPLFKVRRSGDY